MNLINNIFKTSSFDIKNDDGHTEIIFPYCEKGELIFFSKKEKWVGDEEYNNRIKNDPNYDSDFQKFYYLINLVCSNHLCNRNVISAGEISAPEIYTDNNGDGFKITSYTPRYFSKSPHLISLDSSYPTDIQKLLESSFELFWIDRMSCANKIRICLESLMDYYNVPRKSKKRDGKFKNLTLHDRIKKCKVLSASNNENFALAIKWIGNIGSHNTEDFSNEKLFLAYELLDYILQDLFINQNKIKELAKKAKIVNKSKGKKI